MLEIRLHVQDTGKESYEHGDHSMIKIIFTPPNVVEVLNTEIDSHTGKTIVSRKRILV